MFASSVAMYLLIRKSDFLKIPTQWINLSMFIIPLAVYLIPSLLQHNNFVLTPFQFFIVIIAAIFFSYLGNTFSLKSIEFAPNPGFSLMISKSYVVMTTLVAVVAFHASLNLRSDLAILMILGFSALIMIGDAPKNAHPAHEESRNSRWLLFALGAFLCWGMLSLSAKLLLTMGVQILPRLIYATAIVSVLILAEMKVKKVSFSLNKRQFLYLLVIGVCGSAFNFFQQTAFDTAPNLGYVNAINAGSIAAVTFCAAILFKDQLTVKKVVGVIGVLAGLVMLVVG